MADEPRELSNEAKAEIAEALRLLKEDKLVWRAMGGTETPAPHATDKPAEPVANDPAMPPVAVDNGPQSPPAKDIPDPPPAKKKAGLYWGSEE
jgi:hypothetical protein